MINFLVTLISDLFLRSKTFIYGLEAIASLSELIWHGEEMGDRRRRARRSVIMHLQVIIRRLSHRLAVFLALSPFMRAAHRESRLRFSSLLQRSQLSAVLGRLLLAGSMRISLGPTTRFGRWMQSLELPFCCRAAPEPPADFLIGSAGTSD